jgi:hypothetical protein
MAIKALLNQWRAGRKSHEPFVGFGKGFFERDPESALAVAIGITADPAGDDFGAILQHVRLDSCADKFADKTSNDALRVRAAREIADATYGSDTVVERSHVAQYLRALRSKRGAANVSGNQK